MKHTLILAICMSFLICFDGTAAVERYAHTANVHNRSNQGSGDSLYQLNSQWTDQNDKSYSLAPFQATDRGNDLHELQGCLPDDHFGYASHREGAP